MAFRFATAVIAAVLFFPLTSSAQSQPVTEHRTSFSCGASGCTLTCLNITTGKWEVITTASEQVNVFNYSNGNAQYFVMDGPRGQRSHLLGSAHLNCQLTGVR